MADIENLKKKIEILGSIQQILRHNLFKNLINIIRIHS